ncbi:MAG: hypothetical protein E5X10_05020, partial [Mesorhizobium sp.]
PQTKAALSVAYCAGLRVAEVSILKVADRPRHGGHHKSSIGLRGFGASEHQRDAEQMGYSDHLVGAGPVVLMTTFPELDHYGYRQELVYVGPTAASLKTEPPESAINPQKVFCYCARPFPPWNRFLMPWLRRN